MEISLKQYNIEPNGVIHIGAGTGSMAKYWHQEGVYQVVWIEKNQMLYNDLYQNTSPFGMNQLYYIQEIGKKTNDLVGSIDFKNFWRKNSIDIDIETYDLLYIATTKNLEEIILGFDDFIKNIKHIVLQTSNEQMNVEKTLNNMRYNVILETNKHVIYEAQ